MHNVDLDLRTVKLMLQRRLWPMCARLARAGVHEDDWRAQAGADEWRVWPPALAGVGAPCVPRLPHATAVCLNQPRARLASLALASYPRLQQQHGSAWALDLCA